MIPQLWCELICLFVFMFPTPEEVYFYYDKKTPAVLVMSKGNFEQEDEKRRPQR